MKSLVYIALAALTSVAAAENQCPTSNGYITTGVHAEAKTSFLHTVQHHWKFEFWRGAVCWGSPDDQYQDKQDFNQNSNQCVGSINFTTNRANQMNYTPMTLSWGANLTDEDTFTINLDDKRIQAVHNHEGGDCTSHDWGAKLDRANVTYETKAVINVPVDVWIVQVRANAKISPGSTIGELHPTIGRVALKDDANPEKWLLHLDEKEWTYLYVEPGEALELNLSYASQHLNGEKKYNVQYDFKFIGHNRCIQVMGDPKTVNYSPDYLNKQIFTDINSDEDFHNYAVKLGCMRNPVMLQAAMNNSGPDRLVPTLEALNKRTEDVITKSTTDKSGRLYATPFLSTILDMTMVDISRFALNDLLNYCGTYRDFRRETLSNPGVTQVAGVEYMMLTYSHLQKIYSELLTQSLAALTNNVQDWSNQKITYAQLFDGNADAQKALTAYQQSMVQMGLSIYPTMATEISTNIPQVEINKTNREALLSDLKQAKTLASYVNVSIRQLLRNFGNRSNDVVDGGQISTNVQQLLDLHAKIQVEMKDYFKWFIAKKDGGDSGDEFVKTLATLQDEILRPSVENLAMTAKRENLKSLDDKFVRRSDLNKLNADVVSCIFNPYGGGK